MKYTHKAPFDKGYNGMVSAVEHPEMMGMEFGVVKMAAGDVMHFDYAQEGVYDLMSGSVTFAWNGNSETVTRKDVFHEGAILLHVPQNTRVTISAESDAEIAVSRTENKRDFAARLLRPGGYYAIHEMSLVPDYLRPELKEEIQKDLARTIRVNARPLTVAEWTALAEEAGFEVLDVYPTDMALLEPKRLLADEGPAGVAKIAFNLARKPQIRERVLGMRGVFRRHADHIGAIGLSLRTK